MTDIELSRKNYLAGKIVIVDGIPGCGKTMLAPIVSTLDRVELATFSYELEHILSLRFLNKITDDACSVMIKNITDLIIYNQMMSREVNFRLGDLSSVFRYHRWYRYIMRMFSNGDELIPDIINKEDPILLLTTHQMAGISRPLFDALYERLVFIEVVRHPLYMITQNILNMDNMVSDVRDFDLQIKYKDMEIPYYTQGYEKEFLNANSNERSVLFIYNMMKQAEQRKKDLNLQVGECKQFITIPFEQFVLAPDAFVQKMCNVVKTKVTLNTNKEMKKQKVPRTKTTEGKVEKIYVRCGWKPGTNGLSEKEELTIRRKQIISSGISGSILNLLDDMSLSYENKYLNNIVT